MSRGVYMIEGIGPRYAQVLKNAGVATTDQLLQAGSTARGRAELASKTGLSVKLILKWVNMCDLFRVRGVASQYAELLEAAGVDTVKELRNRNSREPGRGHEQGQYREATGTHAAEQQAGK